MSTRICLRCEERGKTWEGSDPRCAFPGRGLFVSDNWNCATMGLLRSLVEGFDDEVFSDDHYAGFLSIPGGAWLLLQWYKRRGRTDQLYLMREGEAPYTPTLEEVERALSFYEEVLIS